jgi:hypothetical protein
MRHLEEGNRLPGWVKPADPGRQALDAHSTRNMES